MVPWDASVAQLVKHSLGFGSGPDLRVTRSSPASGSALVESPLGILSLPLPLPLTPCSVSHSNKYIN